MLTGDRVRLRPLKKGDDAFLFEWRNNWKFVELAQSIRFPKHELLEEEWLNNAMADISNRNVQFILETIDDQTPIGFASITGIDWISKNAYVGFSIMSDDYQGKGYSHEGFTLTLDYAFNYLNLEKTISLVLDHNEASKKMCFNASYEIEGKLKRHYFWENEFHDVLYLSAFRDVFNEKFKSK